MLLSLIRVPLIGSATRGVSKYVRPAFREGRNKLGESNVSLGEDLSGIREIKAFAHKEIEAARHYPERSRLNASIPTTAKRGKGDVCMAIR
jgi:ABC-type multidrug transport system fused ATPase/permease subunit